MRGLWILAVMVSGVGMAQVPAAPAPGQQTPDGQKTCQYTVTDESGNKVTGTTNCTPKALTDTPATKRFPYPGEATTPAGDNAAQGTPPDASSAGSTDPNAPVAKRFPFPGEPGEGKPAPAPAGGLQDAGSSGSSSSSSGDSSSSSSTSASGGMGSDDPNDVNSDTPPAPKRNQHRPPVVPPKDAAQQEAEDLQVASFYMDTKNWAGAYGRAQEAVKLADDDADAHLALAEAARKMGKLDEAEKNYRRTLELDPVPKSKKAAQKALEEMTGGN